MDEDSVKIARFLAVAAPLIIEQVRAVLESVGLVGMLLPTSEQSSGLRRSLRQGIRPWTARRPAAIDVRRTFACSYKFIHTADAKMSDK